MKFIATISILLLAGFASLAQPTDSLKTDEITSFVDYAPSYPGGPVEMNRFIKKNLKVPASSKSMNGKVYVLCIVNIDGTLSDFKIQKGLGEPFDNSAIQLVTNMPKWIPAKKDGEPVKSQMVLPISFKN